MVVYLQNQYDNGALTADMSAVFSTLDPTRIVSVGSIYGGVRVQTNAGYTMDITGTNLVMDASSGSWVFGGDVSQIIFKYDNNPTDIVTLRYLAVSLASVFAPGTALFSGDDVISGGFGSNALYGYGGNDQFYGGMNGAGFSNVHDTLYGGDGNDVFTLTLVGDPTESDPVIFGGTGNDQLNVDWYNLGNHNAVLDGNHLSTMPDGIERLRFSDFDFINGGVVYFKATVLATPGEGYLAIPGLAEIDGLKQINAASAGVINLSAVAMKNEGTIFRYNGTSDNDAFSGPKSFDTATDIAYYGHGGNDTLAANAAAAETLFGGEGDDTYTAVETDIVTEVAGQGNDTLQRSQSTDLRDYSSLENLTLLGTAAIDGTGTSGSNVITGNNAANYLIGGGGLDTLQGAGGNDTYLLGTGVTVIEGAGAGTDTALSFATATLASNVERLVLLGSATANGTGNALANRITGNDAANRLDGGALADILIGDDGDDTYVYGAGDVIVEFAGGGTDTVESSVSYTLGAEVERLVLTGSAAINGTGNALGNRITGNSMANILDGAGGNDTLIGGLGNDIYVAATGDLITETSSGGTGDRVRVAASYALGGSAYIEVLETTLATGTMAINLTGNSLGQTLIGNAGANFLNGSAGNDTLTGGAGADSFVFTTAPGTANIDLITDFSHTSDTIRLDNAVFTGLGATTGALAATAFWANTTGIAHDTSDRIIYNTATGVLTYDSNGSTAGGTIVQFARLTLPVTVDATDFLVI